MTIVITGATKGIGRAISEQFAQQGFSIIAIARNEENLKLLAQTLEHKYPNCQVHPIPADLSQQEDLATACRQIKSICSTLHILVNNAGLYLEGEVLHEPIGQLEQMLALNLLAPYHLCRELIPLIKGKGHIFNICSVASQEVAAGKGSYAISKHALLTFNKALRQETLDTQLRVTAILPGATWTSSWEGAPIPQERLMPPEDIAQTIWDCWQLSDRTVVEELVIRPQKGKL